MDGCQSDHCVTKKYWRTGRRKERTKEIKEVHANNKLRRNSYLFTIILLALFLTYASEGQVISFQFSESLIGVLKA
jgi:hypothetical protein